MFKAFLNKLFTTDFILFYNDYLSFNNDSGISKLYFNFSVKQKVFKKNYLWQKYYVNKLNANNSRELVIQNLFDLKYFQLINFVYSFLFIFFIFLLFNFIINLMTTITFSIISIIIIIFFFLSLFLVSLMLLLFSILLNFSFYIIYFDYLFFVLILVYLLFYSRSTSFNIKFLFLFLLFFRKLVFFVFFLFVFFSFKLFIFVIYFYLNFLCYIITLFNIESKFSILKNTNLLFLFFNKLNFFAFLFNNYNIYFIKLYCNSLIYSLFYNLFEFFKNSFGFIFFSYNDFNKCNYNKLDQSFFYFYNNYCTVGESGLLLKYNYLLMSKLKFKKMEWLDNNYNNNYLINQNLNFIIFDVNFLFDNNSSFLNSFNQNLIFKDVINWDNNKPNLFMLNTSQSDCSNNLQLNNILLKKILQFDDLLPICVNNFNSSRYTKGSFSINNNLSSLSSKWDQSRYLHLLNNKNFFNLILNHFEFKNIKNNTLVLDNSDDFITFVL